MTEQEKQERLDAVRNFLDRAGDRPFILAGAAYRGGGKIDGMRLSDGIETAGEAKSVIVGIFLTVISPTAGTAKQRQQILTDCMMEAFGALEEEREAGNE